MAVIKSPGPVCRLGSVLSWLVHFVTIEVIKVVQVHTHTHTYIYMNCYFICIYIHMLQKYPFCL